MYWGSIGMLLRGLASALHLICSLIMDRKRSILVVAHASTVKLFKLYFQGFGHRDVNLRRFCHGKVALVP